MSSKRLEPIAAAMALLKMLEQASTVASVSDEGFAQLPFEYLLRH